MANSIERSAWSRLDSAQRPETLLALYPTHPPVATQVADSFFRDAVASMRNGVIVVTTDGRLAHINREACRILGIATDGDHPGRPFRDVLRSRPEIVRILQNALELGNPPNRAELRLRPHGPVVGYTVCLVRNAEGEQTGATLLFKDLTRVEQLEERDRLRDRLAALGEMAATIAHEVRNPLASIKVLAGLLKRRMAGIGDAESLLVEILDEAKLADAIVIEILDFVRPLRLQVEPVVLERVIDDALQQVNSRHDRGSTDVRVQVPSNLPALEGDPNQLRQLFANLLSNSIEALGGTGQVTVSATLEQQDVDADSFDLQYLPPTVVVSVTDDGPGVPAELRDRIFSPFFSTKAQGTGLGLAIVKKIVDAHDGRIDLLDSDAGGACFRVTLPVTVSREAASPFAGGSAAVGYGY